MELVSEVMGVMSRNPDNGLPLDGPWYTDLCNL
jgi:hypothetical protein